MNKPGTTANLLVPTTGAFFFVYLLFLFLFWRPMLLLGDGGIARHIITGQYILEHHALPTHNYVWAINPAAPWVTHEIVGDLILGGTCNLLGLNGVDLLAAVTVALTVAWCYQFGRIRGIGNTSGLLMLIAVMGACSIHWSARAHLLSYVPFMLCYFLLFVTTIPHKFRAVALGVLMLFWTNLHGSYIMGLGMIALKLFESLLKKSDDPGRPQEVRWSLIFLGVAGACSLLNVRGFEFITYVFSYVTNPMIRSASNESRPIDIMLGMPIAAFLLLGIFVITVWIKSPKKPSLPDLILGATLFGASFYSMRLIPYFALLSLAIVGSQWAALRSRIIAGAESKEKKGFVEKLCISEARIDSQELELLPAQRVALLVGVVAAIVFLVAPPFHISDFDPNRLPVEAVKQKAYIEAKGLGFNYDNWGDYLYWHDKHPIFIDEKTDFYDPAFLKDYTLVYTGGPNFEQVLDKYRLNWMLVPKILPAVERLPATGRWKVVYSDETSAILQRL